MNFINDMIKVSSEEIQNVVGWYGQRITSVIKKSSKKPHLSHIFSVLKRDMSETLSEKIANQIKNSKKILTKKEILDLVNFLCKVASEKVADTMDFAEKSLKERSVFAEKEYLWMKSMVIANLNLELV